MPGNRKFLVNLFHGLNHRHLFFSIWAVIIVFFISLIIAYYKKATQRNFKEGELVRRGKALAQVKQERSPTVKSE